MPNSSKFTCSVCWHEAESLQALERHWAIHLSHYSSRNDRGFYGCDMCGREFSGLNSLRKGLSINNVRNIFRFLDLFPLATYQYYSHVMDNPLPPSSA